MEGMLRIDFAISPYSFFIQRILVDPSSVGPVGRDTAGSHTGFQS